MKKNDIFDWMNSCFNDQEPQEPFLDWQEINIEEWRNVFSRMRRDVCEQAEYVPTDDEKFTLSTVLFFMEGSLDDIVKMKKRLDAFEKARDDCIKLLKDNRPGDSWCRMCCARMGLLDGDEFLLRSIDDVFLDGGIYERFREANNILKEFHYTLQGYKQYRECLEKSRMDEKASLQIKMYWDYYYVVFSARFSHPERPECEIQRIAIGVVEKLNPDKKPVEIQNMLIKGRELVSLKLKKIPGADKRLPTILDHKPPDWPGERYRRPKWYKQE